MKKHDTIAQIATPPGRGGVGVIRISGPSAHRVGRALVGLGCDVEPRRISLRTARAASGESLDEGLYFECVAPRSFTGEAVAEFQAHGGRIGLGRVLGRCCELGARPAEPGEFSLRAFLNGRLDLAEAEATADAIMAESEAAHRVAQRQLAGELSARIRAIQAPLVDAATSLTAEIEFPDEGLAAFDQAEVAGRLGDAEAAVRLLLEGHRTGRLLREGAVVVIAGPPNAGKSSLMNALVGYERAIVSPVAGTTRDTVEDRLILGGMPIRLIDTAGLRRGGDVVEAAGVERARSAAATADLVLAVVSADSEWAAFVEQEDLAQALWVLGKSDLGVPPSGLTERLALRGALAVSAQSGVGLGELEAAIGARLGRGASVEGSALVTLERHRSLLDQAHGALRRAREALGAGVGSELVLVDVKIAVRRLGEVLGEDVGEEVLAQIFKRFCVGK